MPEILIEFDPDFAWPSDWAAMYRRCGLQVVPGRDAAKGKPWKMPALPRWADLADELAPQETFDRWYGSNGEHVRHRNLGIITGRCSGNVFVIDLDDQKGPDAQAWWQGLIEVENNGIDPETAEQRTGGGGRQKLFRAPPGWRAPTNKTSLGVDIRGQVGFAMMPASLHESGREYEWLPGRAPWETEIADAKQWLLDAVEALAGAYGGDQGSPERTLSPNTDYDAFGNLVDGRETVMRNVVWRGVLEWYRECPIRPPERDWRPKVLDWYNTYEGKVQSRIIGEQKRDGLEREGRGPTAFAHKWRATMRHWGSPRMVAEAAKPNPKPELALVADPKPQLDSSGQPLPLVLTAEQFVAGFTPPAYLVDGIIQRGYLYSLTARTGHGKTAFTMYLAQCLARGKSMHGHEVKHGTVLVLAGENPDDIRARFLVLAEAYGFVPEQVKMRFVAGVINIAGQIAAIRAAADEIPDLILVIVDTAAAYFPGDETNSNSQQGAYARVLRELTFLPGKPAVLVNCHPIKNAAQDNLLPMGGSAFLNEVDGNLTLWADAEKQISLHWLGKFRGPEFEPMSFELRVAESARVHDAEGRLMPSVVAIPIAEAIMEEGRRKLETDENRVLRILAASPNASFVHIAERAGFVADGRPSKTKVHRVMANLVQYKFAVKHRSGKYKITEKGEKEIGLAGSKND